MSCQVCQGTDTELYCRAVDRIVRRPGETWDILRCRNCGFGWTAPVLNENQIAAYYPPTYLGDVEKAIGEFQSGSLSRSRSWRKETEKVRLVERYLESGRILDVGCGDGRFLWALDPRRWERTGAEFSQKTVELVKARVPALHLVAGDIHSEEFDHATFDVVTLWHALEHLPDPRGTLRRAASLLGPGGWLVVSLPNIDSLQARLFRGYWYGFDDVPRHLYHYSKESLVRLLEESGLEVRRNLLFSRLVNFHSLKHSLLHWSEDCFGNRLPYYALKPLLFAFPMLEQLTGLYGILTTIARKGIKPDSHQMSPTVNPSGKGSSGSTT